MNLCYYCGQPASSTDHVVSQKVLSGALLAGDIDSYMELIGRGRKLEVPSCQQCNSILGGDYDQTLMERKYRLKARLKQKLARDLAIPDWTEEELAEMGPRLRSYIQEGIIRKQIVRSRLAW